MKKHFIIPCIGILLFSLNTIQSQELPRYKDPKQPIEKRVQDLLDIMTIEEKVYQLCALRLGDGDEVFRTSGEYSGDFIRSQMKQHGVGHISCPTSDMHAAKSVETANEIQRIAVNETRLGIPTIINDEALHGCKGTGSTSYPQAIALSSTWDLDLMSEIADAIGQETVSRGIRQVLSPNLDLARDPRHGRMEETYGEDPFVASKFGVKFIQGVQNRGVICSPKHFVANFVGDGGRDSGNIALSERELREIHFPPYKAAVKEAGVQSLMAAYNAIDGVPCSANYWLLTKVLRDEWGFDGFTVSDWSGVNHTHGHHKITESLAESAIVCSKAGLDVDLPRLKSYQNLVKMVEEGNIKEASIDENVRRVLRMKFTLGLFENPYIEESKAAELQNAPQFRKLALKAAQKSIILLKNENNILPVQAKKIAIIGPNAKLLQLGGYSAAEVKGPTPLEGIEKAFGKRTKISYALGCDHTSLNKDGFSEAITIAKQADVCILVMGGAWGKTGGENQDRVGLDLMGVQEDLIHEITATGKPVIVVLNDGRPATITKWIDKVDGLIMMFFAGEEGGTALGEIISGKINPSGKLTLTWPRDLGQIPMPLLHRPYGREGSIAEYPEVKKDDVYNPTSDNRYYPLFPFGYGLSYAKFKYDDVQLDKSEISKEEAIKVTVDITNDSEVDGDEIVQLYLTDMYCRISQSKKIIKGFKKVSIPAGKSQKVEFTITPKNMSFLNEELKPEIEAGEFEVLVGTNCLDGLTTRFRVK